MKTILQRQSCLVCFYSAFGTFEYLQDHMGQQWMAAASSSITPLRSVDLDERIKWRMQTGSAFFCFSFGLSFLYALGCRRRSGPMLFLAFLWGPSHLFSWKEIATRLRISATVLSARGASFCCKKFPWQIATAKGAYDFHFVLSGKSIDEQVVAKT